MNPRQLLALALDPSLILATRPAFVDIETQGELTRGFSHIDHASETPNCSVVTDYDTTRFLELVLDVLNT